MPTLLIDGPFRFFWYSADRLEPPHVHVERDDRSAKYWLDPVRLARNNGLRQRELAMIARIIAAHQAEWLERWQRELGR